MRASPLDWFDDDDEPERAPRGYADIKALQRDLDIRNQTDLLALAEDNDPYFSGRPAHIRVARWFATLWRRFGFGWGNNQRQFHYLAMSRGGVLRPDGTPYEGTKQDWMRRTLDGAKHARYQELIDADEFEDRRHPQVRDPDGRLRAPRPDPSFDHDPAPDWTLPQVETDLARDLDLALPEAWPTGYDYDRHVDQPFHIEVWCEKSTEDALLEPLCQELGVWYQPSTGTQSDINAVKLLKRAAAHGKPLRVFYISDWDEQGRTMPIAVGRHIQFHAPTYAPGLDVKLTPLALDADQARRFGLRPVEGTTDRWELDALDAQAPGVLERLVRSAVALYQDPDLEERLVAAEDQARDILDAVWDDALADTSAAIAAIDADVRALAERYRPELEALNARWLADLAPIQDRLDAARQGMLRAIGALVLDPPEFPERPTADVEVPDERDWLLDVARRYLHQTRMFQRQRPD